MNTRRGKPAPKQFPFVENPATVLLIPMSLGEDATWWSFDGVLLGGIRINGKEFIREVTEEGFPSRISYLPLPIPRSWGAKQFGVVIEYEAEDPQADFFFNLYYGCGDPSELVLGKTDPLQGEAVGKQRQTFYIDETFLKRNELFRFTLEINRSTPHPILVYGAWLELTL